MFHFYLVSILVVFLETTSRATISSDVSLWLHSTFNDKSCTDLSASNLKDLDKNRMCKNSSAEIQNYSNNDYNEIAEFQTFQQLASEQYENLNCQKQQTELINGDTELVKSFATDLTNKLPLLKEQKAIALKAFNDYQSKLNIANQYFSYCRQSLSLGTQEKCFAELSKLQSAEKEAFQKWQQHESTFKATQTSLWQGSSLTMQGLVQNLIKHEPLFSISQIFEEIKKNIPHIKNEISDAIKKLEKQSTLENNSRNFNQLSDTSKRQLLESEAHQELLATATKNKDEAFLKLNCRLEGKYTKGRDQLENTLTGATFVLGGFASVLSKIPIVMRAGTAARFSQQSKKAGSILGHLAVGFDTTLVAQSIQKSCLSESLNGYSSNDSCTTDKTKFRNQQLAQLETDNCILTAALDMAPAGILTGSVAYSAFKKNRFEYEQLRNELGPQSQFSDLVKKDAKNTGNRINQKLTEFESINSEKIKNNQLAAEDYITKNKIPLKVVPIKIEVDQEQLNLFREGANRKVAEIKKLETDAQNRIDKLLFEKQKHQKEMDALKLELTQQEKVQSSESNFERRAMLKKQIHIYEEYIKETYDDEIIKIKAQLSKEKIPLDLELSKIDGLKSYFESPRIKTEFVSSLDNSAMLAAARGKLSENDIHELVKSTNDRKVYRFLKTPKSNPNATGTSPFWQHPQFAERIKELQKMGVEVIVDPQKTKGAHYSPSTKAIYLKQDADFHLFEHEFTHAQFDHFVADKIQTQFSKTSPGVRNEFRSGTKVESYMSQEEIQKLGLKNVQHLQELVTKYNNPLTVDESLAVKKQLDVLGWRPLNPEYHWTKIYGSYYRVNELMERKQFVKNNPNGQHLFTAEDSQLLDRELVKMGQDIALMRGTRAGEVQVKKIREQIESGKTAQALASYRALSTELEKSAADNDTQILFNDNGEVLRISEKGTKLEKLTPFDK